MKRFWHRGLLQSRLPAVPVKSESTRKKRKDYIFWHQLNEKRGDVLNCPIESTSVTAGDLHEAGLASMQSAMGVALQQCLHTCREAHRQD